MAKSEKNLSKSPARAHSPTPLACAYLFHTHFRSQRAGDAARTHQHPFWQLEIILSGTVECRMGEEAFQLKPKEIILIPPFLTHSFRYPAKGTRLVSMKFQAGGSFGEGRVARPEAVREVAGIREAILGLLPKGYLPSGGRKAALESLLSALMLSQYGLPLNHAAPSSPLAEAVAGYVSRQEGRRVTVVEVARALHISPGHLSSRLRTEKGGSLKALLDDLRAERAKGYLAYSDQKIQEIARAMGFPDLFSFSRFFKRLTGWGPRAYRKANR